MRQLLLCGNIETNQNREWDHMKEIAEKIKYLPASNDPLSADVYFIEGDKYCYIYDVGNNTESLHHINRISNEKIIILSHRHKDHIGNIEHIRYRDLYVGRETFCATGKGEIVENVLTIHDGLKIEIIHCISPHTDGSLIININNEYTLIADLYFTRPPFDQEKTTKMLASLRDIDTQYFVVSHQNDANVIPKEKLIAELTAYFTQ